MAEMAMRRRMQNMSNLESYTPPREPCEEVLAARSDDPVACITLSQSDLQTISRGRETHKRNPRHACHVHCERDDRFCRVFLLYSSATSIVFVHVKVALEQALAGPAPLVAHGTGLRAS